MEEGQPGSPKGSNRTGNPAIGTLSWQSFQERDPTGYRKLVISVMRDDFTHIIKCSLPVLNVFLSQPPLWQRHCKDRLYCNTATYNAKRGKKYVQQTKNNAGTGIHVYKNVS